MKGAIRSAFELSFVLRKKRLRNSNEVSFSHCATELGGRGLKELRRLIKWLSDDFDPLRPRWGNDRLPFKFRWVSRFAPSIITRSEAEVFGVSMPRFCIRIYMNRGEQTFVNLRRLATMVDQARNWTPRNNEIPPERRIQNVYPESEYTSSPKMPKDVLLSASCIADSLLKRPTRLAYFSIIEAPLAAHYGETNSEDSEFAATPFMKHIRLTGGLCAQAVAFMSTALLVKHAKGIFGLAEITCLGRDYTWGEMELTGLTSDELIKYFSHPKVGLRANLQTGSSMRNGMQLFSKALKSYVLSKMPVVLIMDKGRMDGLEFQGARRVRSPNIREHNSLPILQQQEEGRPIRRNHAVLAIGCSPDEFLLNDPAGFPFIRATTEQIYDATLYETDFKKLRPPQYIPVTPKKVLLPLQGRGGMFEISDYLRSRHPSRNVSPGSLGSEFRLIQASEIVKTVKQIQELQLRPPEPELEQLARSTANSESTHWIWIQIAEGSIWIWDAELPIQRPGSADASQFEKFLLGIVFFAENNWHCECKRSVTSVPTSAPIWSCDGPLDRLLPSMISSCSLLGLSEALNMIPPAISAVELYVFMQRDCDSLVTETKNLRAKRRNHYEEVTRPLIRRNLKRFPRVKDYYDSFKARELSMSLGRKLPVRKPFSNAITPNG